MKKECLACKRVVSMELLRTREIHYGAVEYWIDEKGHRLTEWQSP